MVESAKSSPASEQRGSIWLNRLRVGAMSLLILLSSLALGAYVVVHWAERQIFNSDSWVALVSPLPKQPVVSTALGSYISNQIFAAEPIQDEIAQALPPRASFLASPLTGQLQSLTTKTAQKVVASDGFQTIWAGANRLAMNRLTATARGQTPPLQARLTQKFNLNLSDVSGQLRSALGSLSSAIPALQPASRTTLTVTTNLHTRAARLHQMIRGIDFLAAVLPPMILAGLLWTIAMAHYRRRVILVSVIAIVTVMLLELIAIKGLRQSVLDQVHNSANLNAVGYIYDVLVGWLRHMILTVIVTAAVVFVICLLAGRSALAKSFQQLIRVERLSRSRFLLWWREARAWMGRYQYYLWLAAAVLTLIYMAAMSSFSWHAITSTLAWLASFLAIFYIMATPRSKAAKR